MKKPTSEFTKILSLSAIFLILSSYILSSTDQLDGRRALGIKTEAWGQTRVYDDNNGILYIAVEDPSDIYSLLSEWHSRYPGRYIQTTTSIEGLKGSSVRTVGVLITYTGW